ncbi:MAG: hypothetical protein ACJ73D_07830, partial [Pyrinomonadaceae bacterium]
QPFLDKTLEIPWSESKLSCMRLIAGIIFGCVTFAMGTGVVRAVESAIVSLFPVNGDVRLASTEPYRDSNLDSALADAMDFRLNGVRIGTTEKEMRRLLGRPNSVENYGPESEPISGREYNYSGLTLEVIEYEGKRTVDSIEVEWGAWSVNGVSIGSSVNDVKRLMGRPISEAPGMIEYKDISSGGEVDISIKDGRVTQISVAVDAC